MKRFLSMLIAVVMVLGMLPATSYAEEFDTENFVGIVLTVADSSFTVEMHKGITSQKTLMTPVHTEGNAYYYEVSSGAYCYFVKPTGSARYSVRQNFYVTSAMAKTKTVWDVTPAERTGDGWDPKEVWSYSDEMMESAFPSSPDLWPDYAELLKVPALTNPRTEHQMTTQTEMMDYIAGLDDQNDNMYVFDLGKSGGVAGKQLDIPVVFFSTTDLSGANTWQEAAQLVHENGKLTALYQAQMHGNEPAAGEAALGMLKAFDGSYGEGLLNNMNICVLPRLNVYGAYKAQRYVYVSGKDVDPNRDFVKLDSQEILLRTQLFLALEPEVFFDNHEYQLRVTNTNVAMHDVKLNSVYVTRSTADFQELSLTLAYEAFNRAEENGLGYGWYDDSTNGYNASVGTTNTAMRGCLSFLTETNGIYGGNQQLERRMMSHISVVTGILDYVNANTAAVQKVVDDQRQDLVNRGKTYEESDFIVLKTGSTDRPDLYINGKQVSSSGKITNTTFTCKAYDVATRSRTAPTAYVIPAGESWTEAVLENMALNGISYTKLPAGSVVQLQQYTGTTTEAVLTEEKEVSFPQGAYVLTMAQTNSYILAVRMEPDMGDGSSNTVTFAREGVIPAVDGTFPIYRYIRDLNSDDFIDYLVADAAPAEVVAQGATTIGGTGKITGLDASKTYEYRVADAQEYTAVAPGSTEIADLPLGKYVVRYMAVGTALPSADAEVTVGYALSKYAVYVDSAKGSSTNDAYTPDSAASTYSIAKGQLDLIMQYAPAGTTGEIHLIGTYNMTKASSGYLSLQKHDYPLLITGGTLVFKDTGNDQKFLKMGGDTTFDNITLQVGSDSNAYYLCGEGYKLTIGPNVTTPAYNSSKYFNIMGGVGEYGNSYYAAQTDLTILSGTWRYVFAGGYVSSVTGTAKLKASNCSVARIGSSHNGKLDGDLYMELDNITVRSSGALYGGNMQKNNVAGNVTMVLGEGISASAVYAGSMDAGNVGGTVTVVADGIDLTRVPIYGKPKNTTGSIGGLALELRQGQLADVAERFITRDGIAVTLGCDQTKTVTLPYDINLVQKGYAMTLVDLNGNHITGALDGSITVKDSKTDDYTVADGIYGTVPAATEIKAAPGYLAVTENGVTSFHKYEMVVTELVVNTEKVGITYKADFKGDEKVKSVVKEFGIALRAYNRPNATSIWVDADCKTHRAIPGAQWQTGSENTVKSVYVHNILAGDGVTLAQNKARAEVQIYGAAYIKQTDGTILVSDACNFSLKTAMQHMASSDIWQNYLEEEERTALAGFYTAWQNVMQDWTGIDSIKAQASK